MPPWALLLMLISISQGAGAGDWDHPACTEGVVSVTRGAPAEMTCNISNPFSKGRSAKMVTEEARDSQAGQYMWTLVGRQTEQEFTTLNVSEPPEQPSTPSRGTQDPLSSAQDPPPGRLHVALLLVPMLLCILAQGGPQF